MERRTLTLRPRVDPATKPKLDPTKVALSEDLKARYVDRGGRYIFQLMVVSYAADESECSRTWVDVPLVPETYVG